MNDELKGIGQHLQLLLDEIKLLHDLIYACIKGLSVTQAMPNAVKVLAKVTEDEGKKKEYEKSFDETTRTADIAKMEIDKGFPFLFSQASLMLYAHLEGAIKRFVIDYFKLTESILDIKEVANLKIGFAEYQSMDEVEQYDYLFSVYEKNICVGMQYGITRFETLLSPIGFSGEVDNETSRNIYELSQIRNNILHRGGIADKYLIKNCPFLNLKLGDNVVVTRDHYERYYNAIANYVLNLAIRLGEKRGKNMEEFKK